MDFYICEYTQGYNFVDWFTYRQLNHVYYQYWTTIIYPNWCKYVQHQLYKSIGPVADHVFKTKHSLFGSFLLKCIYQVSDVWDNDVDLLGNSNITYDLDIHKEETHFTTLVNNIYKNKYKIKTELYKNQGNSFGVRKFNHTEYRDIDHVIILDSKPHHEFVSHFDFDFCKICFDGNKLFISNLQSIINKSSMINITALENCFNMTEYGFRCDPCVRRVNYVYDKLIERMDKYTNRGFRFVIDLNGISDLKKLVCQVSETMDKENGWVLAKDVN